MVENLKKENRILRDNLLKATGKKRIILNDSQRRRLAILGKKLGRKLLSQICVLFPLMTTKPVIILFPAIAQKISELQFLALRGGRDCSCI